MVRIGALTCIFFILCGCATFEQMRRGLDALRGENIRTAYGILGYPSGKKDFGNETVYYWSTSGAYSYDMPITSNTYGSVGTVPYSASTTYYSQRTINYSCLVKIVANQYGTITTYSYYGNLVGCEPYIFRLNDYYESKKKSKYKF